MCRLLKNKFDSWCHDISGATAVEYGLIVAAIAVTIIAGITVFGEQMNAMFLYFRDRIAP